MPPVVTSVAAPFAVNEPRNNLGLKRPLLKLQLLQALIKYIASVRTSTTARGLTDEVRFSRLCDPVAAHQSSEGAKLTVVVSPATRTETTECQYEKFQKITYL